MAFAQLLACICTDLMSSKDRSEQLNILLKLLRTVAAHLATEVGSWKRGLDRDNLRPDILMTSTAATPWGLSSSTAADHHEQVHQVQAPTPWSNIYG